MSRTIIGAIVLAALLLLLVLAGPAACNKIRSLGAQNRLNQEQTEALANSAADAVATQGVANKREGDSETLTRSNEKDIRNAPGATDPVNPAAHDIGLRSLCKRAAYRDSERCRLLSAPSK
jgi:hypothetical protein